MTKKSRIILRATLSLVGAVIGVGIFGLPYIFAQSGFFIGLGHLVVVGAMTLIIVLAYADIVLHANGHQRLSGNVKEHLGSPWGGLTGVVLFASNWGAMLAYILLGGGFLHSLIGWLFGGSLLFYQSIFFLISAIILIGGLGFVSRIESIFIFILTGLMLLIIGGSAPFVHIDHLLKVDPSLLFAPFGVVFFAFGGIATVPEMKAILGRYKASLKKSIMWAFGSIVLLYILFTATVVSVTGSQTSQEAILGLGDYLGDWAVIVGSLIGLFAVFTSFLILGVQIMDTAIYDYKARYLIGWAWAITVPFLLFLAGARNFINVIGFTGGVFGVCIGLLVISMYWKAKSSPKIPKRALRIPYWVLFLIIGLLLIGMVTTIAGVL